MKTFRAVFFLLFIACVPSFAHHMAVVTSKQNTVTTMTAVHLGKMFRTETKKWPDGKDVVLVLHKASPGEAVTLQHLNRMTAKQWQTWVADHKGALRMVDSDQEVLTVVETTPGAIGMVDVRSVNDHITVIRVDGKLPMEDGYLSH